MEPKENIFSLKLLNGKNKFRFRNALNYEAGITHAIYIGKKIKHSFPWGYDSVIRRMQSWVCLLYSLYNTHEFILRITWCHVKNELVGVVKII